MRRSRPILLLCALLVAAAVLRLAIGPGGFGFPTSAEVWTLRIDRTLAGIVVGAALALGGVFLQNLLRNPLASPDLIGPASGAAFAVMLSMYLSHAAGATLGAIATTSMHTGAAIIGSLGAIGLVYAFSQRQGFIEPVRLVLVGVVISIMFGAATMFLIYLMPDRGLSVSRWTIGAISDEAHRAGIGLGLALIAIATIAAVLSAPVLDALSLSDDEAIAVGVPVRGMRVMLFLCAGLLTSAAVVVAGPVGFIGLISPHLVRRLCGPGHLAVIPGSAACGAALVLLADAAIRAVDFGSGRMPLGIVTALLGGVTFIWIMQAKNSGHQT